MHRIDMLTKASISLGGLHRPATSCPVWYTSPLRRLQRGPRRIANCAQSTTSRTAAASSESGTTSAGGQHWLVAITSYQGFEKTDDDGWRLIVELFDHNGERISQVFTDGTESWGRPRSLPNGWTRRGLVKVQRADVKPAAVKIRKQDSGGQAALDYISEITVSLADSSSGDILARFPAETWVSSQSPDSSHKKRIFFAETQVPSKTPCGLKSLRDDELKVFKGTDSTQLGKPRQAQERIYDYQVYNDLSSAMEKREALGATYKWPYPRRLATHKGSEEDEVLEDRGGKPPWLPYDETFQFIKQQGFTGGLVSAAVPAVLEGLGHVMEEIKQGKFQPWRRLLPVLLLAVPYIAGTITVAGLALLIGLLMHKLPPIPIVIGWAWAVLRVVVVAGAIVLLAGRRFVREVLAPGALNYTNYEDVLDHYSWDVLPPPFAPTIGPAPSPASATTAPPRQQPDRSWMAAEAMAQGNSFLEKKASAVQASAAKSAALVPDGPSTMAVGEGPPTPNSALVAAEQALNVAKAMFLQGSFWSAGTRMKKPRVLQDRQVDGTQPITQTDEEFGRQMLAGFNPVVIAALKQHPKDLGSAITDEDVEGDLEPGDSISKLVEEAAKGEKPRLYWVDHWDAFAHFFTQEWKDNGKALHAGRALLYLEKDGENDKALVPIAIELAAHPANYPDWSGACLPSEAPTSGHVYSRSKLLRSENKEEKVIWDLAKLVFKSLDVAVHQLVSHFLRTHAVMEPFLIALRRNLSHMHPVYKLMLPHFRYTLAINAAARDKLISAGGIVETTFAAGEYAMRISSLAYKKWRFVNEALPKDLELRGMVDENGTPWISDYPYAVDGMGIWTAMETYFSRYLDLYYEQDQEVEKDEELQAWWKEVRDKGHPDLVKFEYCTAEECWGKGREEKISTKADLVQVLVTIAWIGSALHAAVNFGQYDYTSLPLNAPSLIRKPMPRNKEDPAWKELVDERRSGKDDGKLIMQYVNDPITNLLVALTVSLLSTHSTDEQTLDMPNTLLNDENAIALNKDFIAEMKLLEVKIDMAHRQNGWVRGYPSPNTNSASEATYSTMLVPSSAPGLTMRGVPYSVSI